jgi:O-antigen ligase
MGLRRVLTRDSFGALVLALAIPLLFLDETHQPALTVGIGSTEVHARLSDAAVVAVLLAALVATIREGAWRLTAARMIWIPGVALLVWLGFEAFRPAAVDGESFDANVVSYVELIEYALLAVAVPLLVRRALELAVVVSGIVLWSFAATTVAAAQFAGLDVLGAGAAGARQPSFLTVHDLAALSALAAGLAAAAILATRRRMPAPELVPVALVAGGLGLVLSGSVAAVAGLAAGALLALVAARRRFAPAGPSRARVLALAAFLAVLFAGVTAVRSDALERVAETLGASEDAAQESEGPHRELLAYLGLRAFQDHPILGVGWQRSSDFEVVGEYLADARDRYPDASEEQLPSAERELNVGSLYVQLLADAGAIGLVLLVALGVGGLVLCWRTAAYASSPWAAGAGLSMMCALPTLAGEWALVGLLPGIPLQSATGLALGLAAAGAAIVEEESGG